MQNTTLLCSCVAAHACHACASTCLTLHLFFFPILVSFQRHMNGGKKRQRCPTGAGGVPDLSIRRAHAHTEPEPHPVSPWDAHHPVADSSGSGSHQESQSHSLQHRGTHTAAEVRLSPHTQPLSHDQRGEGSASFRREAHQTHGAAFPQISSAGKV